MHLKLQKKMVPRQRNNNIFEKTKNRKINYITCNAKPYPPFASCSKYKS